MLYSNKVCIYKSIVRIFLMKHLFLFKKIPTFKYTIYHTRDFHKTYNLLFLTE